jgi:hypothetical protein
MDWTTAYFFYKEEQWVVHKKTAEAKITDIDGDSNAHKWEGYKCYAARQAHVYHQLAQHAQSSFQQLKANRLVDHHDGRP